MYDELDNRGFDSDQGGQGGGDQTREGSRSYGEETDHTLRRRVGLALDPTAQWYWIQRLAE